MFSLHQKIALVARATLQSTAIAETLPAGAFVFVTDRDETA